MGNEGLAREALARREALLNQATGIGNQIDAQAKNIDTLYEGMMTLEKKIVEAKGKQNEMAARARTAKSTQKINDMLGGLTGKLPWTHLTGWKTRSWHWKPPPRC